MAYLEEGDGSGALDPSVNQLYAPIVSKLSNTSISVRLSTLGVTGKNNITTYKVIYQKMTSETVSAGPSQTITSATNPVNITNLTSNSLYKITTQFISSSGEGNTKTLYYTLSGAATTPGQTGSPKNVGDKVTAKSYLVLTGGDTSDKKYSFAYRDFESIQLGTYTNDEIGIGANEKTVRSYSPGYYSFGTSIIMPPLIKYKPQGAGLGFFLNSSNDSGYFVIIETSATAAASNTSPVKIIKLVGKQIKKLKDSQSGNRATLDQLFAGKVYNLDVKVKIENKTVTITAYINGFKVEARDETSSLNSNEILYPSSRVAALGVSGTSMFDYIYADTIKDSLYNADYQLLNFYNGQFSKDFLDLSYGDMLYNATNDDVDIEEKKNAFDEFGTVVREISRKTISFSNAPAVPIRWTTGANKLAQIIAQSYDSFKADVFVLNNSSITVPLSDKGVNQLSIFGNTIGFSGEIEYSTSPAAEYSSAEPVIFESSWLQNSEDVKRLAEWIQGRVVNKAKIVTMKIFGNALISVGDIITIEYAYQGLTSTQKIIIVKVSQRFNGGLETEIVGRTL